LQKTKKKPFDFYKFWSEEAHFKKDP
jgi:hypothetical protein